MSAPPRPARPSGSGAGGIEIIEDLSQYVSSNPQYRILFYGGPGVGKTHVLGTAVQVPELGKCGYIGFDDSWDTISHLHIPMYRINRFDQMRVLFNSIMRGVEGFQIDTLLIDAIEGLYQMYLQERLDLVPISRPDTGVPAQQDYLSGTSLFRSLLNRMSRERLPINIIATCHRALDRDAANITSSRPNMPGKLAEEISQHFSIVGYLYTKVVGQSVEHFGQFQPYGRIYGKERAPAGQTRLGAAVHLPADTLPHIFNALRGGEALEQDSLSKLDPEEENLVKAALSESEQPTGTGESRDE